MEAEVEKIRLTKNHKPTGLKKIDYLLMLAFAFAILLALVGAVVSSGFFF